MVYFIIYLLMFLHEKVCCHYRTYFGVLDHSKIKKKIRDFKFKFYYILMQFHLVIENRCRCWNIKIQ